MGFQLIPNNSTGLFLQANGRPMGWAGRTTVVALLVLIVGCTSPAPITSSPTAKGGGTLTVDVGSDAANLSSHFGDDTASEAIRNALYDNLVAFDDKNNVVPQLALSWETSTDGKTWTFKLRTGVKFHDGSAFGAQAVKENFDQLLSPDHPVTAAKTAFGFVDSLSVVDANTVRFSLKQSFGPFLYYLASSAGAIESPTAQKKFGKDIDTNPVGAGPFKFVEWQKGNRIAFERFDDYWGGRAKLDRIIYRVIPSASTRTIDVQTGTADIAWQVNLNDVDALAADANVALTKTTTARTVMFWINTAKKPFDDVRVRQALNYAIDQTSLIKFVLKGYGTPACSLFGPGILSQAPVLCYDYNVTKAKQLLSDAGYPNGFPLTLLGPQGRYTADKESLEAVAGMLQQVGIKTTVKINGDFASYIGKDVRDPAIDLAFISIVSPAGHPSYYSTFLSSANIGKPFNLSYINDKELDSLMAQALAEPNLEKQKEIYTKVQKLERDQAYHLLLNHEISITGVRKSIQNLRIRPTYALIVRDVAKD
jgi:peptide/nickel transport system substrate-binding protein